MINLVFIMSIFALASFISMRKNETWLYRAWDTPIARLVYCTTILTIFFVVGPATFDPIGLLIYFLLIDASMYIGDNLANLIKNKFSDKE